MVKVDIKADSKFPVDRKAIRKRIVAVLEQKGLSEEDKVYVSVSIIGDRKMRVINRTYRQKDYATDVLSFPTHDPSQKIEEYGFFQEGDEGLVLGDIIVSYPQAVVKASEKNKLLDEIVCELVEHGLLHLLGIHHD